MIRRKVVIAGGTGHLGRLLMEGFEQADWNVVVLSRRANPNVVPKTVAWDGVTQGPWSREIDGADVVINLAGRSVDCRYTEENRREILESRVESAKAIGTAISKAIVPPLIWMQMSTATIYAHRYDAPNDERKGIIGDAAPWDFSIEVAKAWESAVDAFALPRTRVIKLRTAMVMTAAHGSPFDALLNLVRAGVGGRAGDGLQFVSWIHHRDFVRSVLWLIAHPEFHGVVNLAAPNPLPNATFMRTLRDAWGARVGLPIPVWLLEAGARVIGTEPELILKSRRVVPRRLNESGFAFSFPHWQEAARDLCEDYRAMQHKAPDVRGVTTTAPPAIEQTIGASRY